MSDRAPAVLIVAAVTGFGLWSMGAAAMAEGLPPIEHTFEDGTIVRFSGQINMGVLTYDDGQDSNSYFVDNDNSSSRARVQLFKTSGDWKFDANFEVEYQPLASNEVSQTNDDPVWNLEQRNIRKAEVSLANERFGKLWLGQGSMASDGTAEVDKSGTTVIAYSSIPDTAGGHFFRFDGNGLSDIQVGDAFSNFDGLGRKFRVRYDTPTFAGFGLRASAGFDWLADDPEAMYDIAATYNGDFDTFALEGAIGVARNEASDANIFSASVSGLHKPTGISLTLATGHEDSSDGPDGHYGYVKLGYQHQFFDCGVTFFSIDYYFGEDVAALDSDSSSFGVAAVQNIDDMNLKLWVTWRNHRYDDEDGDYEDGQAFFGGAVFSF